MGAGGAVFLQQGTLLVVNSTLTLNTARGGDGGSAAGGDSNVVQGGGGSGLGGAIFNLNGTVRLVHATVAINIVASGNPGQPLGSGGFPPFENAGPLGRAAGGAVYHLAFGKNPTDGSQVAAQLVLQNSILSGSDGGVDLVIDQDQSRGTGTASLEAIAPSIVESLSKIGNPTAQDSGIIDANPELTVLADNGGPTFTIALDPDSPAIGAADKAICLASPTDDQDQRGLARSVCKNCSLGAFETNTAARRLGEACTSDSECATCFCTDGVCCDTACGGTVAGDCQACSVATGAEKNGICHLFAAGQVCRPGVDRYDPDEICDGHAAECPADVNDIALTHKGGGGLAPGCTSLPRQSAAPLSVLSMLLAALMIVSRQLRRRFKA